VPGAPLSFSLLLLPQPLFIGIVIFFVQISFGGFFFTPL